MLLHFYALGLTLLALLPVGLMKSNLPLFHRLPRSTSLTRSANFAQAEDSVRTVANALQIDTDKTNSKASGKTSGKTSGQTNSDSQRDSQQSTANKSAGSKNAKRKRKGGQPAQAQSAPVPTTVAQLEPAVKVDIVSQPEVRTKPGSADVQLTVMIPARDEEASIGECLAGVLACELPNLQVIVMDDCSRDRTLEICQSMAAEDQRLMVMKGRELPMGWNGKQRACWQMALEAKGRWLLFLDADVRLTADALPRLLTAAEQSEVDLLSGFPKQVTGSWLEKLLIPLMHFILLGYLPLARMRSSPGPEFAAGCGQLFLARRSAYMTCEGHKGISNTRHDGIMLPRAFRRQRFKTDVFDATDLATCRMYHSAGQVVRGLLKNATEGIGNPRTIWIFTILLLGAAVLPVLSLIAGIAWRWNQWVLVELAVATGLSFLPRVWAAARFEQSWFGVLLHPLSVAIFLMLQWIALFAQLCGIRVSWRGRA